MKPAYDRGKAATAAIGPRLDLHRLAVELYRCTGLGADPGEAMATAFQLLGELASCAGRSLLVGAQPRQGEDAGPGAAELALASIVAEREAGADGVRAILVRVAERDHAAWVEPALEWIVSHGRRAIVRTCVPLSREVVACARRHGVTVLLELADLQPAVGAALLGPSAAPAAALLQHAQHLRASELEVGAWLGPLLPAIADERAITMLVRHVAAADLRDAHAVLGRLTAPRLRALTQVVPWAQVSACARAYGIDPERPEALPAGGVHLSPMADASLRHAVRRAAAAVEVRLDHCGCPAHCHLDPEQRPAFVPMANSELFAQAPAR